MAKQLDISIPAFSKIETGITDVNLSRLEQISKLYEMSIVQLLTFNDAEEEQKSASEMESVQKKLVERETELIELQKKVIELYEELRHPKAASA